MKHGSARSSDHREFELAVLVRRSTELPGIWFAEIPDIETMVQGRSPSDAIAAALEAAHLVILHDIHHGIDPTRFVHTTASDARTQIVRILREAPWDDLFTPARMDAEQGQFDAVVVKLDVTIGGAG